MGKRGPAKQPDGIARLKGNPGRRPLKNDALEVPGGLPKCPRWLGRVASQRWREYIELLKTVPGLLTPLDGPLLALLCDAWQTKHDCDIELAEDGITSQRDSGGKYNHPAWQRRREAVAAIVQLSAKFGLTPSDRASLRIEKPKAENPLLEYLQRRAGSG